MRKSVMGVYRLCWGISKPYVVMQVLGILLRAVMPFPNVYLPKLIIDELTGSLNLGNIALYAGLLVLLNFLFSMLLARFDTYDVTEGQRLEAHLMGMVGKKAMTMDFEYTEDPDILDLFQKAGEGGGYSGLRAFAMNISKGVSGVITLIGVSVIVARLSLWLLGLLLLIVSASVIIQRRTKKAELALWDASNTLGRRVRQFMWILTDNRIGSDVRLYEADGVIVNNAGKHVGEFFRLSSHTAELTARYGAAGALIVGLQLFAINAFVGVRVIGGDVGIGDFTMYVAAGMLFATCMTDLITVFFDIRKWSEIMGCMLRFLKLPDKKPRGTLLPQGERHVIEFENVSFSYPNSELRVLKNVSVRIPAGQKLSIVGANGAGKTTFIKLLIRLYDPTEGRITLDGTDIREIELEAYYRILSVVFQDFFFPPFTLRDIITCGRESDETELLRLTELAGLGERFRQLPDGLDTPYGRQFWDNGTDLSGGEQQKLAITRALCKNAPLIVLDEPTAALDPKSEYEVYRKFDELTSGRTAIYISHRLSSCHFCDKVMLMQEGEIIGYAPHDLLLTENAEYAKMYETQAQYYRQ